MLDHERDHAEQDRVAREADSAQQQYDLAKAEWKRTGVCPVCLSVHPPTVVPAALAYAHAARFSIIAKRDAEIARFTADSEAVLARYRVGAV